MRDFPKRLIEVDLPIKRISEHARREKSIRHGHISTLHIWWARRPLAACRAVICASLWLDPADPNCPDAFRQVVRTEVARWVKDNLRLLSKESLGRFVSIQKNPKKLDDDKELRSALLDFIADFANWDNSTVKEFLDTSRALTQAAHEALGGVSGTKPLVVDPFAGGGSIPLEALRVGADAFASDLNPVAVLLNKVVLEYIPNTVNASPMQSANGENGLGAKPRRNSLRSIPRTRMAQHPSPISGRGRFNAKVPSVARKSHSSAHFGWPRKRTAPWLCNWFLRPST
jgi:putative DNA methylase